MNAAQHLFHLAPETRQLDRRAVGAVAMRPVAVDHKERVLREIREVALHDSAVRQIDSAGHVPLLIGLGGAHVEQYEILLAGGESGVDIPAVGLEGQQLLEVIERGGRIGGRDSCDVRESECRHSVINLRLSSQRIERQKRQYALKFCQMARRDFRWVAALAYDRMGAFELGIVSEVFGLSRPELNVDWYRFSVFSLDPRPLHATGGIRISLNRRPVLSVRFVDPWQGQR